MCILKVSAEGTSLEPLADVSTGGDWPRHHLVRDGWLLVAHEGSNDVMSYKLDPASGLPDGPVSRVETGSPSVLVPAS
jgi:6-phosphogluconolactonase (cycloisomerase 2 family)